MLRAAPLRNRLRRAVLGVQCPHISEPRDTTNQLHGLNAWTGGEKLTLGRVCGLMVCVSPDGGASMKLKKAENISRVCLGGIGGPTPSLWYDEISKIEKVFKRSIASLYSLKASAGLFISSLHVDDKEPVKDNRYHSTCFGLNLEAESDTGYQENGEDSSVSETGLFLTSTKRKRRKKMNKHKLKKRRKLEKMKSLAKRN